MKTSNYSNQVVCTTLFPAPSYFSTMWLHVIWTTGSRFSHNHNPMGKGNGMFGVPQNFD